MSKGLFINGVWEKAHGEIFSSLNPANSKEIWQGEESNHEDIDRAFKAANAAFTPWSFLSLDKRIEYLKRYQQIVLERKEEIALAIAMEAGKPLWEAKTEAAALAGKVDVSIEAYHQRTGLSRSDNQPIKAELSHKPHGVVAVLGPYNFPAHLPNGQIVPALLAGNTVLFKPSEKTPLVAEKLIECFTAADFPPGVINLLQGGGETGKALLATPVKGVYFTGSYQTGSAIHRYFAGRPEIILALELGGNNALIVDEGVDIDAACFNTIMSAFITSGQRCTCARRLFIPHNDFGKTFVTALVEACEKIKVGAYDSEPEPFMGPVISKAMAETIIKKQDEYLKLGAHVLLKAEHSSHAFVTPGIIDVTDIASSIDDEEVFGPLLNLIYYKDFNQALELANDTDYGLSQGLFSEKADNVAKFYRHARAGIVNLNQPLTGAKATAPFGGIGKSGNHRPSAYYAADFCAYPMASVQSEVLRKPESLPKGLGD